MTITKKLDILKAYFNDFLMILIIVNRENEIQFWYNINYFLKIKIFLKYLRDFERFNLIREIKFHDCQNILLKILEPYPLILILTSSKK